jgi:hypothetical protein
MAGKKLGRPMSWADELGDTGGKAPHGRQGTRRLGKAAVRNARHGLRSSDGPAVGGESRQLEINPRQGVWEPLRAEVPLSQRRWPTLLPACEFFPGGFMGPETSQRRWPTLLPA